MERGKTLFLFLNPMKREQKYYLLDLDEDNIISQGKFVLQNNDLPGNIYELINTQEINAIELIGIKNFCTKFYTEMKTKFSNNNINIIMKERSEV